MKILAFSGKKGSGKSTLIRLISRAYEEAGLGTTTVLHCGEPIKNVLTDVFGLDHEDVWGDGENKEKFTHLRWQDLPHYPQLKREAFDSNRMIPMGLLTVRDALQQVGRMIHMADPDALCRCLEQRLEEEKELAAELPAPHTHLVLIDSLRRQDIFFLLKGRGPKLLRLDGGKNPGHHSSETELDNIPVDQWDSIIHTSFQSPEESFLSVWGLMNAWGWKHAYNRFDDNEGDVHPEDTYTHDQVAS